MTLKTIKTNVAAYLKKTGGACFCLLGVFTLLCGMRAWGETVTDMSGYVVQTVGDSGDSISSFVDGTNFGNGDPIDPSLDYLSKATLRTGKSGVISYVFGGKSLSLVAGSTLAIRATKSDNDKNKVTVADLRLYDGAIVSASDTGAYYKKELDGAISVKSDAASPAVFNGNFGNDSRKLSVNATMAGNNAAAVKATIKELTFLGDNVNYLGQFQVVSGTQGTLLKGTHKNAFGPWTAACANPVMKIDAATKLLLHAATPLSVGGATFFVGNGTIIGVTETTFSNTPLTFGTGTKFSGPGSAELTLDSANGEIALLAAEFDGVTALKLAGTRKFSFGSGVQGTAVGLSSTGDATFEIMGATMADDVGTLTVGSVQIGGNFTINVDVAKSDENVVMADCVDIQGALAVGTDAKVTFNLKNATVLPNDQPVRVLSASNLDELGTGAFVVVGLGEDETMDVAIETTEAGGVTKKYVTLTRRGGVHYVNLLNNDAGDAQASFAAKSNWDDTVAPEAGKHYVVDGKMLRVAETATFAGDALTIKNGGSLAILGVTATVNDLILEAGGQVRGSRSGTKNKLLGKVTVPENASPACFTAIETNTDAVRTLYVDADIEGTGDIRICTTPGGTPKKEAIVYLRGANTGWNGNMTVSGNYMVGMFRNEDALGGSTEACRQLGLTLQSNAILRVASSYDLTNMTRQVWISGTGANQNSGVYLGGKIDVMDGQTMMIRSPLGGSSAGILKKVGNGTLIIDGANDGSKVPGEPASNFLLKGRVEIAEGTLVVSNKLALGTSHLMMHPNSNETGWRLHVATEEGLSLSGLVFSDTADRTAKMRVSHMAFDAPITGVRKAALFRLPLGDATTAEELLDGEDGRIDYTTLKGALGKSYKVKVSIEETDDARIVYATARPVRTLVIIR